MRSCVPRLHRHVRIARHHAYTRSTTAPFERLMAIDRSARIVCITNRASSRSLSTRVNGTLAFLFPRRDLSPCSSISALTLLYLLAPFRFAFSLSSHPFLACPLQSLRCSPACLRWKSEPTRGHLSPRLRVLAFVSVPAFFGTVCGGHTCVLSCHPSLPLHPPIHPPTA